MGLFGKDKPSQPTKEKVRDSKEFFKTVLSICF